MDQKSFDTVMDWLQAMIDSDEMSVEAMGHIVTAHNHLIAAQAILNPPMPTLASDPAEDWFANNAAFMGFIEGEAGSEDESDFFKALGIN